MKRGSRSRMPRPASASTGAEPSSRRATASGISSISRRIWVVVGAHGRALFARPAQPQFGDEIIGVAPVDGAGEFDHLAARQIGNAFDVQAGDARRHFEQAAHRLSPRLAAEMRCIARTGRLPVSLQRRIERGAYSRRVGQHAGRQRGAFDRQRRVVGDAQARRRAPPVRSTTGRAPSSRPGDGA